VNEKITQILHIGQAYLPLITTYTLKSNTALNISLELSYASFPNHTQFLNIWYKYLECRMYMYKYIYIYIQRLKNQSTINLNVVSYVHLLVLLCRTWTVKNFFEI
jgi:hypothetical protein